MPDKKRFISGFLIMLIVGIAFQSPISSIITGKYAFLPGLLMAHGATSEDGSQIYGTYIKVDADQDSSGKLQLLPVDDSVVLFEFDVVKGNKTDNNTDFRFPGTLFVDENGMGQWEGDTSDGFVSLTFHWSEKSIEVMQNGSLPASVAGRYTWQRDTMEMTIEAAGALLENLPTAATGLNSNNGVYRLEESEVLVDNWFYHLKAVFADTGAIIGEYLVAKDMSAVYRVDTEAPLLIYGSAAPMMAATYEIGLGDGDGNATLAVWNESGVVNEGMDISEAERATLSIQLVDAAPAASLLEAGKTMPINVRTPGQIPSILTADSGNPAVATVDTEGNIQGLSPGTTSIAGVITLDGVEKPFQFDINVWAPSIEDVNIRTTIPVGTKFNMEVRAVGTEATLKWYTSNPEIADIDPDSGVLTGRKNGKIKLLAVAGDLNKEWDITIGEPAAVSGPPTLVTLALTVIGAITIGLTVITAIIRRRKMKNKQ